MLVDAQLFVCAAAEADQGGRVHALGLGTDVVGPDQGPLTVVVRLILDPQEATVGHRTRLRLVDARGIPVLVATAPPLDASSAPETAPLEIAGEVPPLLPNAESGPPWGWLTVPLLFLLAPGTHPGSGLYHWEFAADDEVLDSAPVYVLSAEQIAGDQG